MFEWLTDNPYTCPILMAVQAWLKWQPWRYGHDGWTVSRSRTVRASCMWPAWLVVAECEFWNSRLGAWIRWKLIGNRQREFRLKIVEEAFEKRGLPAQICFNEPESAWVQ